MRGRGLTRQQRIILRQLPVGAQVRFWAHRLWLRHGWLLTGLAILAIPCGGWVVVGAVVTAVVRAWP